MCLVDSQASVFVGVCTLCIMIKIIHSIIVIVRTSQYTNVAEFTSVVAL